MHTLILMNDLDYSPSMEKLIVEVANGYEKSCYISFKDSCTIVVGMLQQANVDKNKFIVVESNDNIKNSESVSHSAYTIPINDLFNVYLFLKGLIENENVKSILLDSVSVLIKDYNQLPLKEMLTTLLLDVGAQKCDTHLVVFNSHSDHEVVRHLSPFFAKSKVM
jgi:hypothetical protein